MVRYNTPDTGDVGNPNHRKPYEASDELLHKFYQTHDPDVSDIGANIAHRVEDTRTAVDQALGDQISNEVIEGRMRNLEQQAREDGLRGEFAEIRENAIQAQGRLRYELPVIGRLMERRLANQLFDLDPNGWQQTVTNLRNQITAFPNNVALAGQQIDWTGTNEFESIQHEHTPPAPGAPPSVPVMITIDWADDDFSEVVRKLQLCGLYGEFTDPTRGGANGQVKNEYIFLKARQSLINKVVSEEKAKLNPKSMYDGNRLSQWIEQKAGANNDNRPLRNALANTLVEGSMLNIQNLDTNHEDYRSNADMRALLAYLWHKQNEGRENQWTEIMGYLDSLQSSEGSKDTGNLANINQFGNAITESADLNSTFQALANEENRLNNLSNSQNPPKNINEMLNEFNKRREENNKAIRNNAIKIRELLNKLNSAYPNLTNTARTTVLSNLTNTFNKTNIETNSINNLYANLLTQTNNNTLAEINQLLATKKEEIEKKKEKAGGTERLTPRQLLVKIIDHELELKGDVLQENRIGEAMRTAGILVAETRTADIRAKANQRVAERVRQGTLGRMWENVNSQHFLSERGGKTAKDIMSTILKGNPKFKALGNIMIPSTWIGRFQGKLPTRHQLMYEIHKNDPNFNPENLDELALMLGECIKGFDKNGKRVEMRKADVKWILDFIDLLTHTSVEMATNNNMAQVKQKYLSEGMTEEQYYNECLNMVKTQENTERDLYNRLGREVSAENAKYKEPFYRINLSQQYRDLRQRAEEMGLKGKERQKFYEDNNFPKDFQKRGIFSVRFRDWLTRKSTWKKFGKGVYYGTVVPFLGHQILRAGWWGTKGVGRGIRGAARWAWNDTKATFRRFGELFGEKARQTWDELRTARANVLGLAALPAGLALKTTSTVLSAPLRITTGTLNLASGVFNALTLGLFKSKPAAVQPAAK